jgi:hypothetical protein
MLSRPLSLFALSRREKLAKKMKGTAKIAYWDTEQGANPPRLIGQIKGTPTIKLFYPKTKKNKNNKKKKTFKRKVLPKSSTRTRQQRKKQQVDVVCLKWPMKMTLVLI